MLIILINFLTHILTAYSSSALVSENDRNFNNNNRSNVNNLRISQMRNREICFYCRRKKDFYENPKGKPSEEFYKSNNSLRKFNLL